MGPTVSDASEAPPRPGPNASVHRPTGWGNCVPWREDNWPQRAGASEQTCCNEKDKDRSGGVGTKESVILSKLEEEGMLKLRKTEGGAGTWQAVGAGPRGPGAGPGGRWAG